MSRHSASSNSTERPAITAVVLCGGRATRLGGVEKTLTDPRGKTLLSHVIARLEPMVDDFVLSVARDAEHYEPFGYPVVADDDPGQGPLAGIVSAVAAVRTPWILTTPADTPFLPSNLVAALAPACARRGAAVVSAGGRPPKPSMLPPPPLAASLAEFYRSGGRAVHRWLVANGVDEVEFPQGGFFNINTPLDLALARAETDRRSGRSHD